LGLRATCALAKVCTTMNGQEPEIDQPPSLIRRFAQNLDDGEVVAFPTETFYGLLARIDRPQALARVFALKGRNFHQPLPVITADADTARRLWAQVPDPAEKLIEFFWPGPLTIVLPATDKVDNMVTGQTGKVGVRVPGSAAARGIAALAKQALAATSANPSDRPPARSAAEVRVYFDDDVIIAEGSELPPSRGSTVVDLSGWPPVLLRAGDISIERLQSALGVELQGGIR